jgi:hypothetical protein
MGNNTVVAVFENYAEAQSAVDELANSGIARNRIDMTRNTPEHAAVSSAASRRDDAANDEGLAERIGNFFGRLFGDERDRDDVAYYSEAVRRGAAVVTVDADSAAEADRAADILHARGAIDVDERAQQWRQSGWAGSSPDAARLSGGGRDAAVRGDSERVIPVVEEDLQIGKRRRDRGGVRIYTHTSEAPVEEKIRLREEHARVERRPADRPATDGDLAAFREGTVEVRESIEEPVIAKKARVVEEVVVTKEISERVESVKDVVQKGIGRAPTGRPAARMRTTSLHTAMARSSPPRSVIAAATGRT